MSWHYVAKLWRDNGLRPHRQGTFKLSRDPRFAEKVVDMVGLYLDPPAGAVVLSFDEKTQVQALDRTQPLLPVDFGLTEKRTHDYKRHGTTNLFAALDVGTGQVLADCYPRRTGAAFLAFLRKAVKPHAGKEIHVVLDNLSTHDTPEVNAWLTRNPNVTFHFTPVGSSWMNQIETWFGIITKQAIRRGTFTSVNALINRIRNYVEHWNTDAQPFVWTATADEILAKVRWVQTNVKKLVDEQLEVTTTGSRDTSPRTARRVRALRRDRQSRTRVRLRCRRPYSRSRRRAVRGHAPRRQPLPSRRATDTCRAGRDRGTAKRLQQTWRPSRSACDRTIHRDHHSSCGRFPCDRRNHWCVVLYQQRELVLRQCLRRRGPSTQMVG